MSHYIPRPKQFASPEAWEAELKSIEQRQLNAGPQQLGPSVRLELSCSDCRHCKSARYTCQGDSGSDVYCGAMNNRTIGDTSWKTPDWCPYFGDSIQITISALAQHADTAAITKRRT